MDLLCVEHQDFTMQIDCERFQPIWNKAVGNVHEENLYSTYDWNEGVLSVTRNGEELANGERGKAVFFDNADYPIWVEFKSHVKEASFNSAMRKVADNFKFHEKRQILSGYLNYGNEIGRSEIIINYTLGNGENKRFEFRFDVLSTKLNYHEHWRVIIRDIEAEYRMLSIDFLKKTFHSFSQSDEPDAPHDIIWWQIFKSIREEFVHSCKQILDRPRHRLRNKEVYQRADKIKRFTPLLENEYARFKKDAGHLYRTEVADINNDTFENRFLKFAVRTISEKHSQLGRIILSNADIPETRAKEIQEAIEELDALNYHPFFRTVGSFKGASQESLILQKDTHYSNVYRTWLILSQSYSLNEGLHNLETKDIATLYEIWCYIQMKEIVRKQLGDGIEIDNSSRIEMNGAFRYELGKGDKSRILFKKGDVELAELIYNPTQGENDRRDINIDNLISRTVPQKPDIVLRLTKTEHENDLKLTYLFDAKYRIDGNEGGVDTPPEDAINQMHRYRDAIYFTEHDGMGLKKEVIGGYILFPGNGETAAVQVARFYKSIDEVNIGAFPLRPKDEENRSLLDEFVTNLLASRAETLLSSGNIIPQKGLRYEKDERLFGSDGLCVAGYANERQLAAVRKTRMYYVRAGLRKGSMHLEPGFEKAKYAVLFRNDKSDDKIMFMLDGRGPRVVTGQDLKDKGFPGMEGKLKNLYLAFDLEKEGEQTVLINNLLENPHIPKDAKDNNEPFFISFSNLFNPKGA